MSVTRYTGNAYSDGVARRAQRQTPSAMTLSEAVRAAIQDHLQTDIAEKTGMSQSQISRFSTGGTPPSLDQIVAIEDAAGRPRGFILRAAGYVADTLTIEDAIDADPTLTDENRRILHAVVQSVRPPRS